MNEINDMTEAIAKQPIDTELCEDTDLREHEETEAEEISSEPPTLEAPDQSSEVILSLRKELEQLKNELENSRAAYERLSSECTDFSELYPDVSVTSLPDSVWQSFKSGVPLAAAYALYEKRERAATEKAANINQKNKELSSGSLDPSKCEEFFSPAEVRAMSAAEVRANYAKIITSMSKWH